MRQIERVLWVLDYFPRPHDQTTGVWALETITAIQQQGVEVIVLSPTPWIPRWLSVTPTLRAWSAVPYQWHIKGVSVFYPKCPYYPHRFVIGNLYNHTPFFDSSVVWWWCKNTVEHIMERHPFQAVHSNFIFPNGFVGREIQRQYNLPLIVHERSTPRLEAAQNHRRRGILYAQVVKEADAVITMNHRMANLLKEMAPEQGDIRVIRAGGNLVAPETFSGRKPGQYQGSKVVLSVGSLRERKGHEYLIRAMDAVRREIPDVKCIIIGAGPRAESLSRLIEELGLQDTVELHGRRPHQEVLETMSWCDVFALPSWEESSGTVYTEAMSFGKPIVMCEGEGLTELVQDGVHGLLVKNRDAESLAQALKRLLRDRHLAHRLGEQGQMLVARELSYTSIASGMIELYNQILNRQPTLNRSHGYCSVTEV